jgi:2-haloacid dehalogenase
MNAAFKDVEACVFDAYGTLLDFNSAVGHEQATLGDRAESLSTLWRAKQLEYTWLRSLMGAYVPFAQVTGDALDYALATLNIHDAALRGRLMDLYQQLAPFPDALNVVGVLRDHGFNTAILTNGSREMIDAGCQYAGLTGLMDMVLSVDEVGIFKPHPSVYQLAVDRLRVPRERIAFVSSNGWDAAGAAHFGFRVVWCNRYRQRAEQLPARPHATIHSLAELPDLLGNPSLGRA